ncbi:hypothetical protein SALBM135S_01170 [Streptomyces alboniger]
MSRYSVKMITRSGSQSPAGPSSPLQTMESSQARIAVNFASGRMAAWRAQAESSLSCVCSVGVRVREA